MTTGRVREKESENDDTSERDGRKTSINAVGTTKISFRRRERTNERANEPRRFSLAFPVHTQGGHYNVCTLARSFVRSLARSRDREERGAHAQFRRNKRELSRTREKHQKTCRAQSDGGQSGPQEGAGSEGGGSETPVGIKGEADKDRENERE